MFYHCRTQLAACLYTPSHPSTTCPSNIYACLLSCHVAPLTLSPPLFLFTCYGGTLHGFLVVCLFSLPSPVPVPLFLSPLSSSASPLHTTLPVVSAHTHQAHKPRTARTTCHNQQTSLPARTHLPVSLLSPLSLCPYLGLDRDWTGLTFAGELLHHHHYAYLLPISLSLFSPCILHTDRKDCTHAPVYVPALLCLP